MNLQLRPGGRLLTTGNSKIARAFAESNAAGLGALLSDSSVSEVANFWRAFVREFFTRLCQISPDSDDWARIPPPSDAELSTIIAQAPPAPGMEYLSVEFLASIWAELDQWARTESKASGGSFEAWLQLHNPLFRLVGRVTFHLTENRRSTEFPFAFLATYTHRISAEAKLQHLPLGKAVKEFAEKSDTRVLRAVLEPVRAAADRNEFAQQLLESKRVFRALAWTPEEAWSFLNAVPDLEESGVVVRVPDWWEARRPSRPVVEVEVDSQDSSLGLASLLRFNVDVALDGEPLTREELEKLLAAAGNLISIKGKWVEIDREKLSQALNFWQRASLAAAGGGIPFHEAMRLLAGFQMRGAGSTTPEVNTSREWASIVAGSNLAEFLRQLRDPSQLEDVDCGRALKAELRPYQQAGLNWLWLMVRSGFGGCLADDMGLGKTLQVIATLLRIKQADENLPPSLLIVPASLIGNWRAEVERFAPSLSIFYAHPSQIAREQLLARSSFQPFDAVLTTYSMLGRLPNISGTAWNVIVIDEAQAIKNPTTEQTLAVKALKSRARIALTGTPIENSVTDLWSLLDFLNPGLLGSAQKFRTSVKTMRETEQGFAPLRRLVKPWILRRLKSDKSVIADLPDKTEVRASCFLTKAQAAYYEESVKSLAADLKSPDMSQIERSGLVLTTLMRLKQICNHPAMWTGSGNYEPQHSGKFKRLGEIASEISARGEKMLIFTQFREMTGPLTEFLSQKFSRPALTLHGGTAVGRRADLVARFQDPTGPPAFVISLKAGGTGLNLTAASHVVHFDRWWNPAVEDQATDRAYRIGQRRNVLVHKFVCTGTIEEKIDRMMEQKRQLAGEIIGQGTEQQLTEMTDAELLNLIALDPNACSD
ncbi:MAG: SNF2 family DNA or RNA helicase [Verrucomicrobiales bacterium]|jgi:SNF2 family DNA or RNA helicase